MADSFRTRTSPVNDRIVGEYVELLGSKVAAEIPGQKLRWSFTVIREDVIGSGHEPISFPGGSIFVPVALIIGVNNEAELAGMLAHSMTHSTRSSIAGARGNRATVPLLLIGNEDSAPMKVSASQNKEELEADRVAIEIIMAAGYNPASLLAYIQRTLPSAEERIRALENNIPKTLPPAPLPSEEFQSIQDRARRSIALSPIQPPSLGHFTTAK